LEINPKANSTVVFSQYFTTLRTLHRMRCPVNKIQLWLNAPKHICTFAHGPLLAYENKNENKTYYLIQ